MRVYSPKTRRLSEKRQSDIAYHVGGEEGGRVEGFWSCRSKIYLISPLGSLVS